LAELIAIGTCANQLAGSGTTDGATRAARLAGPASGGPRSTDGAAEATELAESFGARHLFTLIAPG